ncbi:MAG: NirD/YgiW/YdeI family stress tolerance protein, partial [Trichodesmium sp.]
SLNVPTVAQTPIRELQRDRQVTIQGEITDIWDDEFKLSDGTGEIIVDTDDEKAINLSVGEKVTVVGKYDDDDFDAFTITRQDGTVINIRSIYDDDDDDDDDD